MIISRIARAPRRLAGTLLVGLFAPLYLAGCDGGPPAAPVETEADIQKRQADELAARQKAYGGRGIPIGRNPGKAAAKADTPAPAEAAPAEKKAP
ncbi:hypothetical protein [Paludisphaera mucosa]|uniref:Lipoprotein n=1 Tax=Paludisphaera mucosa TaxID=3030827 RepID=A0ABT6FB91_9BACT|nr:hypothetical protein [Paludisphaera mucosa]MDG3004802.1 hypothetical protein [Paludisphaera mucosa]